LSRGRGPWRDRGGRITVVQELGELFHQVHLGGELGLGCILRDAIVASFVVNLERRVLVAECPGFPHGLSLEIAVVALSEADRWNDGVVAFGKPMRPVHASLHCMCLTWRSRRARWREVREARLRAPVARRDRGQTAPNFLDDYLL